ncbi:MAG: GNAT family N-acetyltransferase [Paracoccaceae bacterium]
MTCILRTPRQILRRAEPRDLADLHEVWSHPAAMRYWSTPEHETIEQTEGYLRGMMDSARDSDDFVIERDGRVIGKAGAWEMPEIAFLLHPDHWGIGLAREAMEAVIPWLFARHRAPALTADVDPRNAASLALLARLGFTETHRASRTLKWRDEWCDSVYLALPREVWAQRPS